MAFWNRRRSIDAMLAPHDGPALKKTLGWPHLLALGVGAIVGTGILTLIGVGAGLAGPAVMISFALAGLVCACAALAYAELFAVRHRSGRPAATLDLMIAAVARSHGAGVVTRDASGFEGCGLTLINPWKAP